MTAVGPDARIGDIRAPVIPLLLLGIGAYFAWFATHYWARDRGDIGAGTGTLWPSDPIKQALQGKGLPAATPPKLTADQQAVETSAAQVAAAQKQLAAQGTTPGTGQANPNAVGQAVASGAGSANQNLGKLLAARYGWAVDPYWPALVRLWNSESGWSNTVWNVSASCGGDAYAYGIPQACGHGTRQSIAGHGSVCPYPAGNLGNPPACGGTSDPTSQINWGLAYIKANYGDPTRVPLGGY